MISTAVSSVSAVQSSVSAETPGNGVPKVILAVGTPSPPVFEDKLKKQGICISKIKGDLKTVS
jgi:hypothetical protein